MGEVETQRDGGVLTITLNRPEVLNAFNASMHQALGAALAEAEDPLVRAVVLTGAGRGFCVGQDLSEFREAAGDIGSRLRDNYHPNILAIRALEKPVIAAVNGAAAGAGLSFACACDIRIASDAASFVPAFINVGLVPDSGGTYFILELGKLQDDVKSAQRAEEPNAAAIENLEDRRDRVGTYGVVGFSLAGAAAVTAGALLLFHDDAPAAASDAKASNEARLVPNIGPGKIGADFSMRF